MNDEQFLAAFEACTIPKSEWTHAAHIRMAWMYLGRLRFLEALQAIRAGIRRYNAAVGGLPTAYHETITAAFAKLIQHRRRRQVGEETFTAFRERNPDLFDRSTLILSRHYTLARIQSDAARERFLEPDLEPLPIGEDAMLPLYEDPWFTFRFADDRLIPAFRLEGVAPGRRVSVYRLDPVTGERLGPLGDAVTGEGGWVDLPVPIVVRAGEAFIAVPHP